MARKTEAAKRLEEALGGALPGGVAKLPAATLDTLTEAIADARRRQARELEAAFTGAVAQGPWPLRGVVRKVVGG